MSTAEMKMEIINRVNQTDDPAMLKDMLRFLNIHNDADDEEVLILSEEQKRLLEEAHQGIFAGKFLTNEQVKKEIDEWLGR